MNETEESSLEKTASTKIREILGKLTGARPHLISFKKNGRSQVNGLFLFITLLINHMESEKFAKYMKERYEDQVNWYREKSSHNQKWAKRVQIIVLICSIITPISAVLSQTVLTVLFSTLVTVLLAGSRYYKFDELWDKYRTTRETLKKEKYAYEYSIGDYENAKDKEKLFIERVEAEISKENTEWINVRKRNRPES